MTERLVTLLERLYEKSKAGSLAWQRVPSGAFQVSFPRYTVSISKLNLSGRSLTVLSILDHQGNTIETIGEDDLEHIGGDTGPISQKLRDTYHLANMFAGTGADKAVEAILKALETE